MQLEIPKIRFSLREYKGGIIFPYPTGEAQRFFESHHLIKGIQWELSEFPMIAIDHQNGIH